MEPREQSLEQTPGTLAEQKKRRFRLVKLEEQRFRMDRLEDRIAPTMVMSATALPGTCQGLSHSHMIHTC